jgi:hypothetical protein
MADEKTRGVWEFAEFLWFEIALEERFFGLPKKK